MPLSADDRAAIDAFRRDVLEASLTTPVLVRFTADWCGPCKQLAPLIDRAIADTGGRAKQVVVDIDRQRLIAEQFRIQSVPTVYAFVGGRPVDGFVGARSEREIKAFLDKILSGLPPSDAEADIEAIVEAANRALADGEAEAAAEAFAALARELPDRADIIAGYARALLALGQVEGAEAALAALPADSTDPAVVQARAALDLARKAAPPAELAALEARIAADPADHQARIDLAQALFAAGRRDAAADQLLASIAADRDWNEGAARAQLLKLIEAAGFGDPWSVATRRRLSQLLFS
ncbi:MAG: tetratricopeptide repeat protein [Sphingomonadaceae bacterium]